jgi:hypothetical protein
MKKIFLILMTSTSFILQAQQEIVTTNSLVGVQVFSELMLITKKT